MTQTPSVPPAHTYRWSLRSPRFLGIVLIGLLLALISFLFEMFFLTHLLSSRYSFLSIIFSSVGVFVGIAVWLLQVHETTLTVTPDGFTYQTLGRVVTQARWVDVERIGRWSAKRSPFGRYEGVWVRPRAETANPGWLHRRLDLGKRFVTLDYFAPDWRSSPLGDDIRRYAPWLLEEC